MTTGPDHLPDWTVLSSAVPPGWFRADSVPDELDLRVDEVVRAALAGDRSTARADESAVGLLQAYAVRAATRAVRGRETGLVRLAATALMIAQPFADDREHLRRMSVVADAGRRLGTSLSDITAELSPRWPTEQLAQLRRYATTHAGGARGLAEMGYRTMGEGASLRYVDELSEQLDPARTADLLEWLGGPTAEVEKLRREIGEPPTTV